MGEIDNDIHDMDGESEEEKKMVWGKHKDMYFNADNGDNEARAFNPFSHFTRAWLYISLCEYFGLLLDFLK